MTAAPTADQQVLTLEVGPMAHGGHCVARYEGRVVFVRHAIPGEVVRARLTEGGEQAKFWRADVIEVLSASDYRRRHIWKLADSLRAEEMGRLPVGGAEFGHITDQHQRRLKGQVFRDTLQRIGGISLHDLNIPQEHADGEIHVEDISRPHSNGLHWRTRVSFAVDPAGMLSMKPHRSNELIELRGMPLAVEGIHESRIFSADFRGAQRVDAVAPGGEGAVTLVVHTLAQAQEQQSLRSRLHALASEDPAVGNILLGVTTPGPQNGRTQNGRSSARRGRGPRGRSDSVTPAQVDVELVTGARMVSEPLPAPAREDRAEVRMRPEGFWQIHRGAPQALVAAVAEMARAEEGDTVVDLYAGAGLFTAWAAQRVGPTGHVLSVEAAGASHRSASELFDGMDEVQTLQAPVERSLEQVRRFLSGGSGSAATVVLDPPRAGAGERVIEGLDQTQARQIIYVSCEPSSFARDAKELITRGWQLDGLRVLDLYPNTHHMESVASFTR
ncbi:class I SAM-dependent RNA methyltransferase [Nesterenkonia lacusekhoensis]|uniref:tRNA/tmRNA/rRNA uracil-C5-methylase (TrmA/RlmC/RlmD family) n=1 Tax=Nesterenkonia lacusekhoensis TaxID=150832 RepID=A0ABS4T0L8_9MICC|nr:class I SAM-dependent RNA methyltransferase [Nesterenkonia lacusekhoensis]MBP2317999.1 tRNA/tmRNA/rRNA uracil-C5-methylase (TrmA/RlmC/RlmD family) [Nesterenkonia lacusekhoensis]